MKSHNVSFETLTMMCLMFVRGVGPRTAIDIVRQTGPLIGFIESELNRVEIHASKRKAILAASWDECMSFALEQFFKLPTYDVQCIGFFDEGYPASLKDLKDPPAMLYVRGALPKTGIACVGTRKSSPFGEKVAKVFAKKAAKESIWTISGMARGIDWACHEASIEAHGPTCAIVAHGLDDMESKERQSMADSIVASGGCIVSEYPFGTRSIEGRLIARDRLQVGLAHAVLAVEFGLDSGTMHAVKGAIDCARPLFVALPAESFKGEFCKDGSRAMLLPGVDAAPIIQAKGRVLERLLSMEEPCARKIEKSEDLEIVFQAFKGRQAG